MPKYEVSVTVEIEKYYIVEAEDEQDAREKAEDMALCEDYGENNMADTAVAWSIEREG